MDTLEIWAAPDELSLVPAWLFQEHRKHTPEAGLIEVALLPLQQQLQGGEPLGLHPFGNLAGDRCRRCAGPRRIFERKGLSEADLAREVERGLEIFVALARKSDD